MSDGPVLAPEVSADGGHRRRRRGRRRTPRGRRLVVRWKTADHRRAAALPAGRAVRPQHGRRARPHRLRRAAARDPRPLRARHQRHPHRGLAVAGGGAAPGAAHRLLRRPAARGCPIAHRRRVALGRVLGADRPGPAAAGCSGIARAGAGLGRAVNDPVHNSLLADYYDIPVRPRVVRGPPLRQRARASSSAR